MFLTREEIKAMTNRTQSKAQVQVLRALGIEHKIRPDGSVLVLRAHVEIQMGGVPARNTKLKSREPNWEAL